MKSGRVYVKRIRNVSGGSTVSSILDSHIYRTCEERKLYIDGFAYRFDVDNERIFITVMPDEEPEEITDRKPFNYSSKTNKT